MTDSKESLRTLDILDLFSARSAWRLFRGMVRAPFDPDFAGSPLAVCWFTNFSCNARCAFCCKAAEIRAGRHRFPPLHIDGARALLGKIRRTVDLLFVSGGEPTLHPPLPAILAEARALGFRSVGMSSNLLALHRTPGILEHLDAICVSLHGPDPETHARALGLPPAAGEQVFANLEMLREESGRRPLRVVVNCVVTAGNLPTLDAMVDFTRGLGFLLEVVPANEKGRAPADLEGNPEYRAAVDRLLARRRSGEAAHLAGSSHYYERIRTFEPFRCFPYGVPNIMPDGSLCTPCDVSEQTAVNVLDHDSLKAAVEASRPHLGAYPCQAGRCFKAGIVERSRLFGLLAAGQTPGGD